MKSINQFSWSKSRALLSTSVLAALVAACGGGGGASAPGTLGVSLTDAPACGFDAVNVTVTKVRINQSSTASENDGGWTDITLNPARKINLLDWNNGGITSLGETPLAAGHYSQLRLVLDPNTANGIVNSVVLEGSNIETPLVTPSAVQSGIKLVNEFDVLSGQRVDLLMDFDACKSIVLRGNGVYALKPVIKVVPFVLNGINGFVDTAMLPSGVMVTAQQNGVIVQTTAPNTTTGEFFLARLPAGTYDVVLTANGRSTAVIADVLVATPTSVVPVSNTVTRITMPTSLTRTVSGTAVLDPASTTELAYVAAKQTFGTTPTVTVKSVAADELNGGAYNLSLPIGEPLLGQFGTGILPIALPMQEGLAGKYSVAASATGYSTQLVSKDIFAADATQAFVLVPPLVP
ncbi:DUF4382 domain-containing protein [Rhodoferax sp.]|uniref:DUF4382 domain-containing protein n=1 Tax=Rhodoferax sp. TaxID=50421 RepID=UPI0025EC9894|nr:DUF4382 domain-containing protein [Rhodoferax sp.]MCM2340913.1 DUF4382 domain-containing protein [Rhodoferax sp.]